MVVRAGSPWWRSRNYVRLATDYFESGRSRCLVGTRGLLGEGWDARRVNVLIDLTAATTSTAVHQSRGRSLRLDPNLPHKVADNWDVVCVSPQHPKGFTDYARFVRKHRHYHALTTDGEVESGVSHVHPTLSPFCPPPSEQFGRVNQAMLERPSAREEVYARWGVGKPYENREVPTLRVRLSCPKPLPVGRPESGKRSRQYQDGPGGSYYLPAWIVAGVLVATVASGITGSLLLALAAGALPPLGWLGRVLASPLLRQDPTGGIRPMAVAVAEGLRKVGAISARARDVRVALQSDGYYRCYLAGASTEENGLFAEALEELLSPLGNPRCIVPRYLLAGSDPLHRTLEALALYRRPNAGSAVVIYHAVPAYFAANGKRVKAFAAAWHRHVSPGRVLYSHGRLAQQILQAQRGENPLEVSTQSRVLWQ